ncbi:ArsA family ATPase [Streptomyces sp. NBC_01190]|uniref:ArsA family ATPase n=1 Tax=Streptomyces sp. NBC_01190 TaxID=2903767 RepID=UPI00386DFAC9|nr:ArsA family ATPase [Streptomyces sp. NBC_01190]
MASVRTLLVTGAPGAGRTTVAAATATRAARAGDRVLLVTGDREGVEALLAAGSARRGPSGGAGAAGAAGPGHPDRSAATGAAGARAGAPPGAGEPAGAVSRGPGASEGAGDAGMAGSGRRGRAGGPGSGHAFVTGVVGAQVVGGVDGLYVAVVDSADAFRDGMLDLQDRLGSVLGLLGAAPLDPEELTALPGAEALALLRVLRRAEVTGDGSPWDLVVVDLPPVREAISLLALPEQLRRYLWRLLPADRQAARALRPVLAQLAGVPMPAEWAYAAAARADRELAAVQAVIEAQDTAVAVVVEPGPAAERTLRTARTGLALHGHRLAAVVANRLLPAPAPSATSATPATDPFLAGLSSRQQDHLKALADQCAADGVPLLELPHLGREPQDPAELAVAVPAAEDRPAEPWTVTERLADEGQFVWTLPLPGAGRQGLDLVRRGDELVVDAGGFRRIVPLPSALRRCAVAGAALRDGALRVRFAPDPDLWPR